MSSKLYITVINLVEQLHWSTYLVDDGLAQTSLKLVQHSNTIPALANSFLYPMESLSFQVKFSDYVEIASLTVSVIFHFRTWTKDVAIPEST